MALQTAGTSTTSVLRTIKWTTNMNAADLATFNAFATYDYTNTIKKPTPTLTQGMLWDPERGSQKLFPGDYVVVDPVSGLVFTISAAAAAGGSFVIT